MKTAQLKLEFENYQMSIFDIIPDEVLLNFEVDFENVKLLQNVTIDQMD
jgi:hypothetical protein